MSVRIEGPVLALDLGTTTGWALALPGGSVISGAASFKPGRFEGGGMRYLRFRRWIDEVAADGLAGVVFEEVRRHAGTDAAHVYGGLAGVLGAWCEAHRVPYTGCPVGTWKRHLTGRGNGSKDDVLAAVRGRGFAPAGQDEADALGILLWAVEAPESPFSGVPAVEARDG